MSTIDVANRAHVEFGITANLCTIQCGECGGIYAILERYREQRWREGKCWTCPYCKTIWGYSGSEYDRLRKRTEQAENRCTHFQDQAKAAERSRRATAGHLTRTRQRIAAGICPCCRRHFTNLERHMTTKHPRYRKKKE